MPFAVLRLRCASKLWRVFSRASFSARLISVHEYLQLSMSDALISWPLNNLQVGEEEGFLADSDDEENRNFGPGRRRRIFGAGSRLKQYKETPQPPDNSAELKS